MQCQCPVGARSPPEKTERSAVAASVVRRLALRARRRWRGLRARAPAAAGSLPRATRSAPKAWALRAHTGAYICSPRPPANLRALPLGGVRMSKTLCASRCSRRSVQCVLRAPAEGEGGVAHREELAAAASATLERSAGMVAHGTRAARERRRRRAKGSRRLPRRPRAAGGPWEARTSLRRPSLGGGGAHTNSELPQAGFPESGEVPYSIGTGAR